MQVTNLENATKLFTFYGLGFMYLRYTQPPADLYDWYEDYLQDEEVIDVKAGGGQVSRLYDYIFLFFSNILISSTNL